MRVPDSLVHLLDEGIIDEVVRPLLAGKEAQIYWVTCHGESRVAKVYKEAQERSFHQRADYTEGRAVRNSRDQRAIRRGSRYGRAQNEKSWQTTEVDTIYRLRQAGVRVPVPHHFIDGVLIMELVADASGMPAPRLSEAKFTADEATHVYRQLLAEVVRMLCAGVIHGDLSDFNVLMDAHGPVIIDFPQAVDAARNANAKKILLRDVENLHRFMGRFIDRYKAPPYGEEIWQRYEQGTLTPTTQLEGRFTQKAAPTDTAAMMDLIYEAQEDNAKLPGAAPRRRRGARPQPAAPARRGTDAPQLGGRPPSQSAGRAPAHGHAHGQAHGRGGEGARGRDGPPRVAPHSGRDRQQARAGGPAPRPPEGRPDRAASPPGRGQGGGRPPPAASTSGGRPGRPHRDTRGHPAAAHRPGENRSRHARQRPPGEVADREAQRRRPEGTWQDRAERRSPAEAPGRQAGPRLSEEAWGRQSGPPPPGQARGGQAARPSLGDGRRTRDGGGGGGGGEAARPDAAPRPQDRGGPESDGRVEISPGVRRRPVPEGR